MKHFPLNLQFFAEGDGGGAGGGTPPANQTPPPAQNQTQQPSADDIAAAIFKAAEARTQRAESGVVKSFADQYGMTEAEARAALDKAKAEKAAKLPDDVQKKLDDANAEIQNMRIYSEVVKEGNSLGLVDANAAISLMTEEERKLIKIDGKQVSGVKEALTAQKERLKYLYPSNDPAPTGQKVNVGGRVGDPPPSLSGVEERFYAKNPGLKKP